MPPKCLQQHFSFNDPFCGTKTPSQDISDVGYAANFPASGTPGHTFVTYSRSGSDQPIDPSFIQPD